MAVHPDFPSSPLVLLRSDQRWFPADEALRTPSCEYHSLYVDQPVFGTHTPETFADLAASFTEYEV